MKSIGWLATIVVVFQTALGTPMDLAMAHHRVGPPQTVKVVAERGEEWRLQDPFMRQGLVSRPAWATRFDGPAGLNDLSAAMALSPDGSMLFTTGSSETAEVEADMTTVAYEAATGQEVWTASHNGTGDGHDTATDIATSEDGLHVYVTGYSAGRGYPEGDHAAYDIVTIAYEALTGAQEWASVFAGPQGEADIGRVVMVSPDGRQVYVGGETGKTFFDSDFVTIALDAVTGTVIWTQEYRGPGPGSDEVMAMAVDGQGKRVFVTGESSRGEAEPTDYATVGYQADSGLQLWTARYDSSTNGSDRPEDLALSSGGERLYVTGGSDYAEGGPPHYATVLYDAATGDQLRVARFRDFPQGSGWGLALAIDPFTESVYVTGGTSTVEGQGITTLSYDRTLKLIRWVARYRGPGGFDFPAEIAVAPDGAAVYVGGTTTMLSGVYDFVVAGYRAATGRRLSVTTHGGALQELTADIDVAPDGSRIYLTGSSERGDPASFDYATISWELAR